MRIRRVVTGTTADGAATVVSDGLPPRSRSFAHIPGQHSAIVWSTSGVESVPGSGADPTSALSAAVASPGGTLLLVVEVPPGSATDDPAAVRAEIDEIWPGLTQHFEPGDGGVHATPTVDYVIMLRGELWLELDVGRETLVSAGDIVIQNGTRHAWHNRSGAPARFAVVQVGARKVAAEVETAAIVQDGQAT